MNKKILLVEDSKTQLRSLKMALEKVGYEVTTACNGTEGVSAVYQDMPDLVVSDIMMPEINGYQLCRLLKDDKLTEDIPIILLTVLDKKLDSFWGIRSGADAYVIKDNNFSNVINQVKKTLEKAKPISSEKKLLAKKQLGESVDIQSQINDLLDRTLKEFMIINSFRNLF